MGEGENWWVWTESHSSGLKCWFHHWLAVTLGMWLTFSASVSSSIKWDYLIIDLMWRSNSIIHVEHLAQGYDTLLFDRGQNRVFGKGTWSCYMVSYLQNLGGKPALSGLQSWSCLLYTLLLPTSPPLPGGPADSSLSCSLWDGLQCKGIVCGVHLCLSLRLCSLLGCLGLFWATRKGFGELTGLHCHWRGDSGNS